MLGMTIHELLQLPHLILKIQHFLIAMVEPFGQIPLKEVCRHLRNKRCHMRLDFHPSGIEGGIDLPCWCLITQQPLGPDSDLAIAEKCKLGRSCFESREE